MTAAVSFSSSELKAKTRPRRSLFIKYFATLTLAVITPLLLGAIFEAWFGYQDQRATLSSVLRAESREAANRIQAFTDSIRNQLGWIVQSSWDSSDDERHKKDAAQMLRQAPAVMSVTLLDGVGIERIFLSRFGASRSNSRLDLSSDLAFLQARANRVWFGPVRFDRGDPTMRIAVAGGSGSSGFAIADVNLRDVFDNLAAARIGTSGHLTLIDEYGRLISHPDEKLLGRGNAPSEALKAIKSAVLAENGQAVVAKDLDGTSVLASVARLGDTDWTIIAQQPTAEAFAPLRAALVRSAALIVVGTLLALALAYWLAQRMSDPIRQLEEGVQRVGAGQFEHRIDISSGDELEELAHRFNAMAGELATSKEKSDRILRLKRFLAPQVAELAERLETEGLLVGQRREIVAIFGDLRGFTAFSAYTEPEAIMSVLGEYYEALGAIVTRYEATLTGFAGDGVMILVNAPVTCDEPAVRGIRLSIDLQNAVQALIVGWQSRGYHIGFGVGVAMGSATVGTVGYDTRLDYTAIGRVVNLASRLCSAALDRQILADATVASAASTQMTFQALGDRSMKGFEQPVPVFSVGFEAMALHPLATGEARAISA